MSRNKYVAKFTSLQVNTNTLSSSTSSTILWIVSLTTFLNTYSLKSLTTATSALNTTNTVFSLIIKQCPETRVRSTACYSITLISSWIAILFYIMFLSFSIFYNLAGSFVFKDISLRILTTYTTSSCLFGLVFTRATAEHVVLGLIPRLGRILLSTHGLWICTRLMQKAVALLHWAKLLYGARCKVQGTWCLLNGICC